jgi:UrcA family protein
MRKFLTSAIAASVVASACPAAAAESVITEVVSFADLDLTAPADRQTLEDRISVAVIAVCGEAETRALWEMRAIEQCRAASTTDAMAQLEVHLASLPPISVATVD